MLLVTLEQRSTFSVNGLGPRTRPQKLLTFDKQSARYSYLIYNLSIINFDKKFNYYLLDIHDIFDY